MPKRRFSEAVFLFFAPPFQGTNRWRGVGVGVEATGSGGVKEQLGDYEYGAKNTNTKAGLTSMHVHG